MKSHRLLQALLGSRSYLEISKYKMIPWSTLISFLKKALHLRTLTLRLRHRSKSMTLPNTMRRKSLQWIWSWLDTCQKDRCWRSQIKVPSRSWPFRRHREKVSCLRPLRRLIRDRSLAATIKWPRYLWWSTTEHEIKHPREPEWHFLLSLLQLQC